MPKRKPSGVNGEFLAGVPFVGEQTLPNDGLDIPDFLKRTQDQHNAAWQHYVANEIKVEEIVDEVELELRADVRKMLAPAGVLTDDITRTLYLATKHAKHNGRAARVEERNEAKEAKHTARDEARAARAVERENRAKRKLEVQAARVSTKPANGKVTINQIATELGILGRDARGALRAMKMKKPEGGWQFAASDVAAIKEKVKSWIAESKSTLKKRATSESSVVSAEPSAKRSAKSKKSKAGEKSTKRRSSSKRR